MQDYAKQDPVLELPHNLAAEKALLGGILVRNETFDRVSDIVGPQHFYFEVNAEIFAVISRLIQEGTRASAITLAAHFASHANTLDGVSIPDYIRGLMRGDAFTGAYEDYARQIYEMACRRSLIAIGQEISGSATTSSLEVKSKDIIEEAEKALYEVAETGPAMVAVSLADAVSSVMQKAAEARAVGGKAKGIRTGLIDLDRKLGGLVPGNLIILAGRPSMGKTALATNIGFHVAKMGLPVQMYSMEMTDDELGLRILAEQSEVEGNAIIDGSLDDTTFDRVREASERISKVPFWIDQTGGLTVAKLATRSRRVKRQRKIGLIIVDYLQLMAGGSGNRVQDVTEITVGLKALAKELRVPIIALSQLSRKVEERPDKRPQLADLRESGSIEQDADVVMFVYREAYYLERTQPPVHEVASWADWQRKMIACANLAEVVIGKQRHGSIGNVGVRFDPTLTRFSNLVREASHTEARHGS